MRKKWKKR